MNYCFFCDILIKVFHIQFNMFHLKYNSVVCEWCQPFFYFSRRRQWWDFPAVIRVSAASRKAITKMSLSYHWICQLYISSKLWRTHQGRSSTVIGFVKHKWEFWQCYLTIAVSQRYKASVGFYLSAKLKFHFWADLALRWQESLAALLQGVNVLHLVAPQLFYFFPPQITKSSTAK